MRCCLPCLNRQPAIDRQRLHVGALARHTDLREDPSAGLVQRLEQEQVIREAVNKLSPRCKQVIEALFFEEPMPSYAALAARLGLSANSIGFTRDRCLERLGTLLGDLGYAY